MARDITAEVHECIASGQTNPEIIAIVLGVSTSEVQRVLDKDADNMSPKQILIEEVKKLTSLIALAHLEYQNFASNNNASAIRTLQGARNDLMKQLAEYEDPTANVRTLDAQVIAPLVRSMIVSVSNFIQMTLREGISLLPPEKTGALQELFDRNFRSFGGQMEAHYRRAVGSVGMYFAVDLDLAELESQLDSSAEMKQLSAPAKVKADVESSAADGRRQIKKGRIRRPRDEEDDE